MDEDTTLMFGKTKTMYAGVDTIGQTKVRFTIRKIA